MSSISQHDREILRRLAARHAEIATLPVHRQTAENWSRLNGLQHCRPLVFISEIPWHEMNVDDELTLQCNDTFCRQVEWNLRTTIYHWEHVRGDMVIEPIYRCGLVLHDTGFGLSEKTELLQPDPRGIPSRHFHPQIQNESDLDKIQLPEVTYDREASEKNIQILQSIFGDLLPVEPIGVGFRWFAPWDLLVTWWGVQEALTDLVDRPELVHAAMDRLVTAFLHRLDQFARLGVLSLNNGNFCIGSGGLGYTTDLPQKDFDGQHVRPIDQWANATPQIFSEVSPAMHEEFALRYERRWLERFGLTYYGCCEPLHHKIDLLRSIKNLRKISVSPLADTEIAARNIGRDYVFSLKPNPAWLAGDRWNLEGAMSDLRRTLDAPKRHGCAVEIIMKDITTVGYEPRRLWEWAEAAVQVAEEYA